MTDAEIAKMLKDQFALSPMMLDISEKYYNGFKARFCLKSRS